MLRVLHIVSSLPVAAAMTVTSPPEAIAALASASSPGVSTLCDGAGCVSVLDSFGAKTHKAAHKRPGKAPGLQAGQAELWTPSPAAEPGAVLELEQQRPHAGILGLLLLTSSRQVAAD